MEKIKCTFNRTGEVNLKEWSRIIEKLHSDFKILREGNADYETAAEYVVALCTAAEPQGVDPEMYFFGMDNPQSMPSDARVDFFYWPTYIATSFMIQAVLQYPELLKDERYNTGEPGKENLIKVIGACMYACTGRGFAGAGYDGTEGLLETLDLFADAEVGRFIETYPDVCPAFADLFTETIDFVSESIKEGNLSSAWGTDFTERGIALLRKYGIDGSSTSGNNKPLVFVYGTLLRGQSNHRAYLDSADFIGTGTIEGYDMFDLGYYPGIVKGKGKVYGEVYSVTLVELSSIDRLEGEGSLYKKVITCVKMDDGTEESAFVYVYLGRVNGCKLLYGRYGEKMVWYVAYGSNLLEDRLKYYIQGGYCPANGKNYEACNNTAMPAKSRQVMIPYNMFYSNYGIGSWKNSAVCFLDIERPGKAYGRAYLVTEEQLEQIHKREGKSLNWYPDKIRIEDIDGIPAYTFGGYGSKTHEPFSRVSSEYGIVLFKGLHEAYPELSEQEIMEYLRKCGE